MGPHGHINVETKPVDKNIKCLGDGVNLANPVKDNVDGGDEDLPDTVDGEEVSQNVEVLALTCLGTVNPLPDILQIMSLGRT